MRSRDYYEFQASARGIRNLADVKHVALSRAHVYDRIVLPWLQEAREGDMAEVACGHGSFLYWAKERGFKFLGIDFSAEQIEFAKAVDERVVLADALEWMSRQEDESLSRLVAIDFIEHIPKEAFLRFLEQSRRILKAGGRLILRYPNGDSPLVGMNLFNDITHVWTYTSNCLRTLAEMTEFKSIAFTDEGPDAIRDGRWLKVPLSRLSRSMLGVIFHAATREKVQYWSPHMWSCLTK